MPNLFEEFRAIAAALGAARVPYAICGGIAMSIHDSLLPCGFVRREGDVAMLTKIAPGDPEVLVVDVIEVRTGATERAWQTRINTEWEGHSVTVVSRAGLIGLKRLRGSPQNIADIALLEEQE